VNYPKADGIILMVAIHTGIPYDAIKGSDKHRSVVRARQVAMSAVRARLGLSYPELGMVFGKDHTTVMNGVKRVRMSEELSATLATVLETLQ
jgi:chromosomal replication initiator protein